MAWHRLDGRPARTGRGRRYSEPSEDRDNEPFSGRAGFPAAAFIGPGTVTASRAGAGYGTALLWTVLFSVVTTFILQDMAARVGLPIRDSLANPLVRARPHSDDHPDRERGVRQPARRVRWRLLTGLRGAGALLMTGTYKTIQNALVALVGLMSVVFFLVAVLSAPDLGALLSGLLIPRIPQGGMLTVLALIGTTVIPYNLCAVLERWPDAEATKRTYGRADRTLCARWRSGA